MTADIQLTNAWSVSACERAMSTWYVCVCVSLAGVSTDGHFSTMVMSPAHYMPMPLSTSFSVSAAAAAAAGQHGARPHLVATTNHTPPLPPTTLSTPVSSTTVKSVQLQLTSNTATTSAHCVVVSQPSNACTAPPPTGTGSPAANHKVACRLDDCTVTSTICHGPITPRTLSPAVKASSDSDGELATSYKVGPAVLDCQMKSEVVWRSIVTWLIQIMCLSVISSCLITERAAHLLHVE